MNIRINEEANVSQEQTVGFSDQNKQWMYSIDNKLDSTFKTADTMDADLQNFFSRPIKIGSINWTVGATFSSSFNPWSLYFTNKRVINRICNYHLLRARLCVRIMINGNGFHYGRALASYRPLPLNDSFATWRMGLVPQDVVAASQRMHVWIDPTKSQGGTLCLPFVFHKNAMNIVEQDFGLMGDLDIASVTTLQHANGGTDSVTLSIFAWAEDVSLSIPTIAEPGSLTPQCSYSEQMDESDMASKGPISTPANAISAAAGKLKGVPTIGPYAAATEMAASGVATVARAFGMSKPGDTGPIESVKPSYVGNMSNANVLDTSLKLTYDVKQQVTIDPSVVGVGEHDEMAISSIVQRESYLTQFLWPTIAVPEQMLWNCYVTPTLAALNGNEIHTTPMAYLAAMFAHWRGSINFRFQIVASSFHKGRIKIVYEPYLAAAGITEYNTQYTHVVDLAKERDFTVTINWGQEYSYLDVLQGGIAQTSFATTALGAPWHGQANGLLYVSVVNDLTTPGPAAADVSVLVSVSGGPDMEFMNPCVNDTYGLFPQSGGSSQYWDYLKGYSEQMALDNADSDLTTNESAPVGVTTEVSMAAKLQAGDSTDLVYFGDPVTSLRQMLKRYEFYAYYPAKAATDNSVSDYILPDFPLMSGYAGSSSTMHLSALPVDPTPFNYVGNTVMSRVAPLFLCRRGGIRWKYIYMAAEQIRTGTMSVRREPYASAWYAGPVTYAAGGSTSEMAFAGQFRLLPGHSGTQCTPIAQNPTLEVEMPFHLKNRFAPGRAKQILNTAQQPPVQYHFLRFPNSVSNPGVGAYVAAGEDFSLHFFQSTPILYFNFLPTPSAIA